MIRHLLTLAVVTSSSLAFGQNCILEGAFGQGAAQSPTGSMAGFSFDVKKLTCPNEPPRLAGNFTFSTHDPGTSRSIRIALRELRALATWPAHASFGGPANMVVRTPQGTQMIPGMLWVDVSDRRSPTRPGDPDLIRLRFQDPSNLILYQFAGAVVHGDIVVYMRS